MDRVTQKMLDEKLNIVRDTTGLNIHFSVDGGSIKIVLIGRDSEKDLCKNWTNKRGVYSYLEVIERTFSEFIK